MPTPRNSEAPGARRAAEPRASQTGRPKPPGTVFACVPAVPSGDSICAQLPPFVKPCSPQRPHGPAPVMPCVSDGNAGSIQDLVDDAIGDPQGVRNRLPGEPLSGEGTT